METGPLPRRNCRLSRKARIVNILMMVGRLSRFRFLLRQTVVREIRVRYKQTFIGMGWAVLQPLVFSAIFVAIFKTFRGDLAAGEHFTVLFCMMSLWTFFANSLTLSTTSISGHPGLVTRIAFPRETFPIGFVAVGLLDLAINTGIIALLLIATGTFPEPAQWAPLAAGALILFLFTFSASILFAGLNVLYRDFRFIVPLFIQILFFTTPIIYSVDILPEKIRPWIAFNPLSPPFMAVRSALTGHSPIDWPSLGLSLVIALIFLELTAWAFHRINDRLADVI